MSTRTIIKVFLGSLASLLLPINAVLAQHEPIIDAGPSLETVVNQPLSFDYEPTISVPDLTIEEIKWNFGDGTRQTSSTANHTYTHPGSYLATLNVITNQGTFTDTTNVQVFEHSIVLVSDHSAPADKLELLKQQAATENILLYNLVAKGNGPEVLIEEELAKQLLDFRPSLVSAHLIIVWTEGGVGANVLTKFNQHIRQITSAPKETLDLTDKGIILVSTTPFAVLQPTAQSAFDQLRPDYVILARPPALDYLVVNATAADAQSAILSTSLDHRLLGTFSARTVSDLGLTNFMSFGINFLVNRGVPVGSIILILMLPVIATIIAFARQIIGLKAFGLITPAMTCISFLVMGLRYGLIVFITIVIAGTITRFIMRKLHLLYLPRMALVLTSVSLALLFLLGLGVANDRSSVLSFSIFPALILTLLAEEFISAQFKSGVRTALTITAWTLVLATACYFIVSSEIFRALILSFPELILLTIPINIVLGQFTGLRLTEYFRFRELLRHDKTTP